MNPFEHQRRKKFSPKERFAIGEREGWVCCISGIKIDPVRNKWIIEHKLALAAGGTNDPENLGVALYDAAIEKTKADVAKIAKIKRVAAKHFGAKVKTSKPIPGTKRSGWRHRMNGSWEER